MSFRVLRHEINGLNLGIPNDWIVIDRLDPEPETDGGLVLPDKFVERKLEGVVVGFGPGLMNDESGVVIPNCVEIGDHVLFESMTGYDVNIGGKEYLWIWNKNIMSVVHH